MPFVVQRAAMIVACAALVTIPLLASPAAAHEAAQAGEPPAIVFPVVGDVSYTDTFGAPRGGGRTHEGTDIMTGGVKGLAVVAAADGVVTWVDTGCCHLAIDHGDGWASWYIHLDNDTPGTDDGLGWGIADGIERGTSVVAGQLIGWVGDSGNAEEVAPQLHFELRSGGTAINPYPYLVEAPVLDAPGVVGYDGQFVDDDGSVHEANIDLIYGLGITRGCNPPNNDRYCPDQNLTRGQVAAFLRRYLGLPTVTIDYYTDDGASIFEDDINALTDAGIGFGCSTDEFCPDTGLRREEMAELLVRTFAPGDPDRYANPGDVDWFTDNANSPFHEAINRLKAAAVTVGCDPPDNVNYCPQRTLTRAEMATFLARAITP